MLVRVYIEQDVNELIEEVPYSIDRIRRSIQVGDRLSYEGRKVTVAAKYPHLVQISRPGQIPVETVTYVEMFNDPHILKK